MFNDIGGKKRKNGNSIIVTRSELVLYRIDNTPKREYQDDRRGDCRFLTLLRHFIRIHVIITRRQRPGWLLTR